MCHFLVSTGTLPSLSFWALRVILLEAWIRNAWKFAEYQTPLSLIFWNHGRKIALFFQRGPTTTIMKASNAVATEATGAGGLREDVEATGISGCSAASSITNTQQVLDCPRLPMHHTVITLLPSIIHFKCAKILSPPETEPRLKLHWAETDIRDQLRWKLKQQWL